MTISKEQNVLRAPNSGMLRTDDKNAKLNFMRWLEHEGYMHVDNDRYKPKTKWNSREDRVKVIKKLVETLQIDPIDLRSDDFLKFGVFSLFQSYSSRSVKSAPAMLRILQDAYPERDFHIWDLKTLSKSVVRNKDAADDAVLWLVKKRNGIIQDNSDLVNENLSFVLLFYPNIFEAVISARATGISSGSMKHLAGLYMNSNFASNPANRKSAVRFIVGIKGSPNAVRYEDFEAYGFLPLLDYYKHDLAVSKIDASDTGRLLSGLALSEAISNFNMLDSVDPPKSLFRGAKMRKQSTMWLAQKVHKKIFKLTPDDWASAGIQWILQDFYNNDYTAAIREAEYLW
ncbi:hypothetical protein M1373_00560 [Candidatus Marsarchaeota archaeon]|nr:hypothetical protein [Candidatus Marsarchaeota archaeon]MCL5404735.1 hypothetical protein [Candidatus Marsarchaeota archaeon]